MGIVFGLRKNELTYFRGTNQNSHVKVPTANGPKVAGYFRKGKGKERKERGRKGREGKESL